MKKPVYNGNYDEHNNWIIGQIKRLWSNLKRLRSHSEPRLRWLYRVKADQKLLGVKIQ